MTYAQTNLQLFVQLQEMGYSNDQLVSVEEAYELVVELFSGQFRPTKKPFVCHLVGTASILGSIREPIARVRAGLLHAAYSHGEFGDGSRGVTGKKQEILQRILGEESESMIERYTKIKWTSESIKALQGEAQKQNTMALDVLTIRLADILEDSLDFGIRYSQKSKKFGDEKNDTYSLFQLAGEVANQLGHHALASDLEEWGKKNQTSVPLPLRGSTKKGSFVQPPKSHRWKFHARLRKLFNR